MGIKYYPSINDFIFVASYSALPDYADALENKMYVDETNNTMYRSDGTQWINMSVSSGLNYKGSWDADTNTPTLVSGIGTAGDFYKVSVAGTTTLDGTSVWEIDDQVMFNGSIYQRIPATNIDNTPVELSVDTTITQLDTVYLVKALSSDITITIPDSITTNGGKEVQILKDSGDYKVIIKTVSSQIIGTSIEQTIQKIGKGFTAISKGNSNEWAINQDSRFSPSIITKTTSFTIDANHNTILANGAIIITLPTTLKSGFKVDIKNIGTDIVTISSSVNIDDGLIKYMNVQYDSFTFQWDGSQWWII